MDWDKLKTEINNYSLDISEYQKKNNNFSIVVEEYKEKKVKKNEELKLTSDNLNKVKLEMIKLSKSIKSELQSLKAQELQYILFFGNLNGYEPVIENKNKVNIILETVKRKKEEYKNLTNLQAKIQSKIAELSNEIESIKTKIKENKNFINSLQQRIANSCMKDEVIECVKLGPSSYKLVVRHTFYNAKSMSKIVNEKEYYKTIDVWYLCRNNKSDKKLNNEKKISTLEVLIYEHSKK